MKPLALAISSLVLLSSCDTPAPDSSTSLSPESEVRVVDMDGLAAELQRLEGKPVLLNFWAMWCPPCVAELPALAEVAVEFTKQGGAVLAVSRDPLQNSDIEDVKAKIPRFLARRDIDLPVLIFDDSDPFALQRALGVDGRIPETFAIDIKGKVVDRHLGKATREQFEQLAAAARR